MEPLPWWGRVGETFYGHLQYAPGAGEGLVRLLGPCVGYEQRIPFQSPGLTPGQPNQVDGRRFEMPWRPRPTRQSHRSLADLGEELANNPPGRGDPRLADLD